MDAREADAMGLLYGIYGSEELLPAARALAGRLAQGSKAAIGLTKKIVNRSFQSDYATMAELEADGQAIMFSTEFHKEAVRRFRKLVERSGIKKEIRIREFYEKPSVTKRRAKLRAERRSRRDRLIGR